MKKKKVEVEEYELSLDKEEKILEGIRDSLKGKCYLCPVLTDPRSY